MWFPSFPSVTKMLVPTICRAARVAPRRKCCVFGIKNLIASEKEAVGEPAEFLLSRVQMHNREKAMSIIKQHYLKDHVLARARNTDLSDDRAIDEYLIAILKQGNTLMAETDDGKVAGICVGFASSPADVVNLRNYAYYRQDPNAKDFLYFTAKLQETPNLWQTFKQQKIFEMKMVAVAPEFRRQGLATVLVEKSMAQAHDQGYKVFRMDCINPHDFKIAERNMLHCMVKFPLHKLRGQNAPFIQRSSPYNTWVRVYVAVKQLADIPDLRSLREKNQDFESLME